MAHRDPDTGRRGNGNRSPGLDRMSGAGQSKEAVFGQRMGVKWELMGRRYTNEHGREVARTSLATEDHDPLELPGLRKSVLQGFENLHGTRHRVASEIMPFVLLLLEGVSKVAVARPLHDCLRAR